MLLGNSYLGQLTVDAWMVSAPRGTRDATGPMQAAASSAAATHSLTPCWPPWILPPPQGGMVTAVLMSAVAMGLPFALAVFPAHLLRYLAAERSLARGDAPAAAAVPYEDSSALADERVVVDAASGAVRLPGEGAGLRSVRGRPDVAAYLRTAAGEARAGSVGVYTGGPTGLVTSVRLAVAELNDAWAPANDTYFELHEETAEL